MIYFSHIPGNVNANEHFNKFMKSLPSNDDWGCFTEDGIIFMTRGYAEFLENVIQENYHFSCFTCYTNEDGKLPPGLEVTKSDTKYLQEYTQSLKTIYRSLVTDVTNKKNPLFGFFILIKKASWIKSGGTQEGGFVFSAEELHKKLQIAGEKIGLIHGLYLHRLYQEIPEERKTHQQSIVVELPYNDITSGGIKRMLKLVVELPHNKASSGGIQETLKLVRHLPPSVAVRFQKLVQEPPELPCKWTVGLPDKSFPSCDVCITYSDNPYLKDLLALPQVKKVAIYMLSYGMAPERERANVLTPNVIVMCSSKKLEKLISADGANVHRVSFGLDMKEMFKENKDTRKRILSILFHGAKNKRYDLAISLADQLFENDIIDGVITFGTTLNYEVAKKPAGLIKHYPNATRDEVRHIFNQSRCFLMPSVSEGLNLTPIEATLCGCPAIICDGAINEIFFHEKNCFVVKKDDKKEMLNLVEKVMNNYDSYSKKFLKNMKERINEHEWEDVTTKIMNIL